MRARPWLRPRPARPPRPMTGSVERIKQAVNVAAASMREGQARLTTGLERSVSTARQVIDFKREAVETFARAGRVYLDGARTICTGIARAVPKQMDETLKPTAL
jgi:hypothetical protein